MEIVLVRHGETDWNVDGRLMGQKDIPLNDKGREQAGILKGKLTGMVFDCCYSSPLSRTRETAEIICENGCKIIYDDRLKGRFRGELEGMIIGSWGDRENDLAIEANEEILERARSFLKMLRDNNSRRVLVVSHNGLIKNLRYCIMGEQGELNYDGGDLANCNYETYEID